MGNMPHDEVTRIMNAMKAAGMNKKELCAALGYKGQQIFTKWIDGRSTSYRQQIFRLPTSLVSPPTTCSVRRMIQEALWRSPA